MRPDAGLLGPGSVTWQLHADPAMWIAGVTSLYLQSLHPYAARAVVGNSTFREDPVGRLLRTADFVGVTSYGTTAEAEAAGARVRAVHRSLRARDEHGRTFRVDEPELLLWVHCAEVYSFVTVVRRAGFRLADAQVDRYYAEQRRIAALVGLHAEDVPGSAREMAAYFAAIRPSLRCGADSEVVYRFLRRPPLTGAVRFGLGAYEPLVGRLAYALLPSWAVALHGRRPYSAATATVALRSLRALALAVPAHVRWRYPGGHVNRAVARLGKAATPSRALLSDRSMIGKPPR
ncbi:oxygenase MpaB family protein [Saccharothrix violaceirubra]|uniref:Uncharacterized protein (DUF2236 family) n=1 Tax=Saccharothrix violaceirubra TaxID=413306 RepID=A0A7W7SXA7_9PSEU|nr:oxygenase MpaB family protein [Saccharothrix violaceirubra]MBB4962695.1 uncharacterized protein (DUF2236 family) [Saccharothrix violaceirubra]